MDRSATRTGADARDAARPSGPGSAARFADAARAVGAAASTLGLTVPGFRAPPRHHEMDRTIRWSGGRAVVAVRVAERPFASVIADMVEGVIVANRLAPADALRVRSALWDAVASADGPAVAA